MATQQNPLRLSAKSVADLEQYLKRILSTHTQYTDLRNKMEKIDIAYYRYKSDGSDEGVDRDAAGNTQVGIVGEELTVPVVVSQVDSFVGYLAEVFLSGYPIFPVVSTPSTLQEAETLEAIMDTHATLGQYPRHLLMSFRDGIKYNVMPIEVDWAPIEQYQMAANWLKPTERAKVEKSAQCFNALRRLDPYNTVWDFRCAPAEVAINGEFAGYVDLINRVQLKRFINANSTTGDLYNIGKLGDGGAASSQNYKDAPRITNLISKSKKQMAATDWMSWLGASLPQSRRTLFAGVYERFTCYCRIIPAEFGITAPAANTPQIWRFRMINGQHLIHAKRIITAYDMLPIMIGQPLEDGFEIQTPSIGEGQIPFQETASTFMNIRFSSARRAVSDRALYDPNLINESDINAPVPAPKIPVRLTGLNDKKLSDAYEQIPFDGAGAEGVVRDAAAVLEMSDQLSGLNKPFRGQFQKGNKSVEEWRDTMGSADNRLRLPAIMTEFQVFMPIKEMLKFNIFQYGVDGVFQSSKTGETFEIDRAKLEKLREKVLSFRVADGYTPKSKLASTDFIVQLLQLIGQSQILQQAYGPSLPKMVAHLAQLGGVRGMDQYSPEVQNPNGQSAAPAPVAAPMPPMQGAAGATQAPAK